MDHGEGLDMRTERGGARYQRLASLLRHRITSGDYPIGERLPTITQLAKELGVAVVTVRQAYQVLSSEGLVRSHRGRGTHVASVPASVNRKTQSAMNDPLRHSNGISFNLLSTTAKVDLPAELRTDIAVADEFTCVRKVHAFDAEPFCYVEIYIPTCEFDLFPSGIAGQRKLLAVVIDLLGTRCQWIRQRTTVVPADFPLCDLLKIPFASPVARVARRVTDADGNVLYGGLSWYRGDRFVSETEVPIGYLKSFPEIGEPKSRSRQLAQ